MVCQVKGPLQLSCYIWPSFGTASTTMDEMALFLATDNTEVHEFYGKNRRR